MIVTHELRKVYPGRNAGPAVDGLSLTIPAFLTEILGAHLQRGPGGAFVFTGKEGGLLRRSNFRRRYWKPALERAGLDTALRFHDMRHTCASLLIAKGAHPKEIQARLGHASITTTLNTYGHLWPSLGAQLDEAMDRAFREARANVANVASMWPEGWLDSRSAESARAKPGSELR